MSAPFANLHILITRPEHQAAYITQQLTAAGATVSCLPVIAITPPPDLHKVTKTLQQIDKYDNVIFVSGNAVAGLFRLGDAAMQTRLATCRVGVIGNQTAKALTQQGVVVDDRPVSGFNSEQFLALPTMQAEHLSGCHVLIVRGEGGRELLAQVLRQRGASVDYAEVYQRVCPPLASAQAIVQNQAQQPLDMIALTSCEGLHNLLQLLGRPAWLMATPLLLGSERIAHEAHAIGFCSELIVAADPSDQSMQHALAEWKQGKEKLNDRQVGSLGYRSTASSSVKQ